MGALAVCAKPPVSSRRYHGLHEAADIKVYNAIEACRERMQKGDGQDDLTKYNPHANDQDTVPEKSQPFSNPTLHPCSLSTESFPDRQKSWNYNIRSRRDLRRGNPVASEQSGVRKIRAESRPVRPHNLKS